MSHVQQVALDRLRQLFPNSRFVREYDRKLELAALMAATGNMTHCARKGCPFPPVRKDGLCRGHAADAAAQFSVLPSMLGNPRPQAHA